MNAVNVCKSQSAHTLTRLCPVGAARPSSVSTSSHTASVSTEVLLLLLLLLTADWSLANMMTQQLSFHGYMHGRRQNFLLGRAKIEAPSVERRRREVEAPQAPRGVGLCPLPRKFFDFWAEKGEFWCILGATNSGLGLQIPICTFPGGGASAPPPFAHSWRRPWLHADVSLICLHDEFSSHTTQRFRALTCNSLCCTFFDCCVQTVFIIWRHYTGGEWNGTWVGFNLHFCLLNMGVFIEDRSLAINLRMKTQNWRHITRYACCHSNTLTQTQLDMLSASVKWRSVYASSSFASITDCIQISYQLFVRRLPFITINMLYLL